MKRSSLLLLAVVFVPTAEAFFGDLLGKLIGKETTPVVTTTGTTKVTEEPFDPSRPPCGPVGRCLTEVVEGRCSHCDCPDGFSSKYCRPLITECSAQQKASCTPLTCVINDFGEPECGCGAESCEVPSDDFCSPNPCLNEGACDNGHCACERRFTGERCELPIECSGKEKTYSSMTAEIEDSSNATTKRSRKLLEYCNACTDFDCGGGVCAIQPFRVHPKCVCRAGFTGAKCEQQIPCSVNPCVHGGKCLVDPIDQTKWRCQCLSIWKGSTCETYDPCSKMRCQRGLCTVVSRNWARCLCEPGYTGSDCGAEIDECAENPCRYNAKCVDKVNDFECDCPTGTRGKRCENSEICKTNHRFNTKCNETIDRAAECRFAPLHVNGYQCACSANFTGEHCETPMSIWNAMQKLGTDNVEYDKLLRLLFKKPSIVKELAPFVLALMPAENQTAISWDHEDLFEWALFEGAELDVKRDFVKWNSPTLGNCFTFNHDSSPEKRSLRYAGEREGFRALMRVRQDEYLDWIDTASLLVFVHSSKESVFGESLRFQAKPGAETSLMINQASFERLGGIYGKCVKDKSEVKSYYYSGEYSVDGCFRSCYQDAVIKSCGCMDPRYPVPADVKVCQLPGRSCVTEVTERRGDPSNWPDCRCPLPCSNGQFNVRTAFTRLPEFDGCDHFKYTNHALYESCMQGGNGTAQINVYFPELIQLYFKEEPKIDLNKFISNLGGLLGALMGFSFLTFVEFVFLFLRVVSAYITTK